jgi:hypothetical protein
VAISFKVLQDHLFTPL